MHSIFLKSGLVAATAVLLSGCSQSAPPVVIEPAVLLVPESALEQFRNTTHNTICNHTFNEIQQSLQPAFEEEETNSVVQGSTQVELLRSLRSTARHQGQGNTRWTVSWSFDLRRNALGCSIANLETKTEVDYHFPVWSGPLDANVNNSSLEDHWNDYSEALRAHHCKHGKTGIYASLEVAERLRLLTPVSSCEILGRDADAVAKSVIGAYKRVEADFNPPDIKDYLIK